MEPMFLPFSLCQTRKSRLSGSVQQIKSQRAEDGQLCMPRLTFLAGFRFCHMCFGPGRRGFCVVRARPNRSTTQVWAKRFTLGAFRLPRFMNEKWIFQYPQFLLKPTCLCDYTKYLRLELLGLHTYVWAASLTKSYNTNTLADVFLATYNTLIVAIPT